MLNFIWMGLVLSSVVLGVCNGTLNAVVLSLTVSCQLAITVVIGLVGVMCLWLGIMRIAEKSGLITLFSRLLTPLLRRLFPEVPADHPAMGAMVMNIAANMLGVGNAATPFGLRAMEHLQTLNEKKESATNAMCTFLAINTSSVQLLPMSAIAILAANGDMNPTVVVLPALLSTCCSTLAGIIAVKFFEKINLSERFEPLRRVWRRVRVRGGVK
jgi:spore maturation protein A